MQDGGFGVIIGQIAISQALCEWSIVWAIPGEALRRDCMYMNVNGLWYQMFNVFAKFVL